MLRVRVGGTAPSLAGLRASPRRPAARPVDCGAVASGLTSSERRVRRHFIIRKKLSGSEERPRLAVFRSNQHIYAQVIDDTKGVTLVGLGSVSGVVQAALENDKRSATKTKDAATVVGRMLAEKCKEKGILTVVFDRGGFKYHGRIAALADGAREAGLVF